MSEQAVNTPDAAPTQEAADATVAQEPDLDSLLAEYDQPAPQAAEPAAPAPTVDPDVQNFMARQIKKENDQEISEAVALGISFGGASVNMFYQELMQGRA